ncbi:MAG: hypothetical protein EZS28_003334 [Streblomastix strix]|uniref:Uncharacterized protein n=1 Tax=Streblomastix strix TaxID=222440 RepID=A0A5J4X1F1_9EUKA|nr:MAG: hypothetical protein EZS28_003334 [Streblomastix strix]
MSEVEALRREIQQTREAVRLKQEEVTAMNEMQLQLLKEKEELSERLQAQSQETKIAREEFNKVQRMAADSQRMVNTLRDEIQKTKATETAHLTSQISEVEQKKKTAESTAQDMHKRMTAAESELLDLKAKMRVEIQAIDNERKQALQATEQAENEYVDAQERIERAEIRLKEIANSNKIASSGELGNIDFSAESTNLLETAQAQHTSLQSEFEELSKQLKEQEEENAIETKMLQAQISELMKQANRGQDDWEERNDQFEQTWNEQDEISEKRMRGDLEQTRQYTNQRVDELKREIEQTRQQNQITKRKITLLEEKLNEATSFANSQGWKGTQYSRVPISLSASQSSLQLSPSRNTKSFHQSASSSVNAALNILQELESECAQLREKSQQLDYEYQDKQSELEQAEQKAIEAEQQAQAAANGGKMETRVLIERLRVVESSNAEKARSEQEENELLLGSQLQQRRFVQGDKAIVKRQEDGGRLTPQPLGSLFNDEQEREKDSINNGPTQSIYSNSQKRFTRSVSPSQSNKSNYSISVVNRGIGQNVDESELTEEMQIQLAKARREAEIERKLMQQELTQHRERAATASKRVRDAHDKLSQLQIEKNDLQQKIQEAEEQLRTTEIERQQVASDAAEVGRLKSELTKLYDALHGERQQTQAVADSLKTQHSQMEEQLQKIRSEAQLASEKNAQALAEKEGKLVALRYENEQVEKQLSEKTNDLKQAEDELSDLKTQMRRMREDYVAMCEQHRKYESEFGSAAQEADHLRMQKEMTENQRQQLSNEVKEVRERSEFQIDELHRKIRELTTQLGDATSVATSRERRMRELETLFDEAHIRSRAALADNTTQRMNANIDTVNLTQQSLYYSQFGQGGTGFRNNNLSEKGINTGNNRFGVGINQKYGIGQETAANMNGGGGTISSLSVLEPQSLQRNSDFVGQQFNSSMGYGQSQYSSTSASSTLGPLPVQQRLQELLRPIATKTSSAGTIPIPFTSQHQQSILSGASNPSFLHGLGLTSTNRDINGVLIASTIENTETGSQLAGAKDHGTRLGVRIRNAAGALGQQSLLHPDSQDQDDAIAATAAANQMLAEQNARMLMLLNAEAEKNAEMQIERERMNEQERVREKERQVERDRQEAKAMEDKQAQTKASEDSNLRSLLLDGMFLNPDVRGSEDIGSGLSKLQQKLQELDMKNEF